MGYSTTRSRTSRTSRQTSRTSRQSSGTQAEFISLGAIFELQDGQQILLEPEWNSLFGISEDQRVSIFAKEKVSKKERQYKSIFLCVEPAEQEDED